jgi:GNAT superfamily N-acetyltransferase
LRSESCEAVTLWRAPGKAHVGFMETLLSGLGYFQTFGTALGLAVSHAMESHHPKGIDYWYLHYAGVRPEHQGKGWGGAAIREGVTRARSRGLPVYLEDGQRIECGAIPQTRLQSGWCVGRPRRRSPFLVHALQKLKMVPTKYR